MDISILQQLKDSCSLLNPGELVHSEDFSLYDTISAIQLLSPKMDTGMFIPVKPLIYKLPPGTSLDSATLLNILDTLFKLSIQHLLFQQSISQTIYTFTILHDQNSLLNPIVHYPILYILPTTQLYINIINPPAINPCYHHEEFSIDTNGFPLFENYNLPPTPSDDSSKSPETIALFKRYDFFNSVHLFFLHLSSNNTSDAILLLQKLRPLIPSIKQTIALGKNAHLYFDPDINIKLFSQIPPSHTKQYSILQCYEAFETLLSEIAFILGLDLFQTSNFLKITRDFSNKFPHAAVLSRSILNNLIFQQSLFDLSHIDLLCNLTGISAENLNDFKDPALLLEISQLWKYSVRFFLFCRSRQHRISKDIIKKWDLLQAQLSDLCLNQTDDNNPKKFTSLLDFLFQAKADIILHYLTLGFELSLYSSYEMAMVSFYLSKSYKSLQLYNLKSSLATDDNLSIEMNRLSIETLAAQDLGIKAYSHMYTAYFKLICLLLQSNYIHMPKNKLYSHEAHYNHRFQLFSELNHPKYVDYHQYSTELDSYKNDKDIIKSTLEDFEISLELFDKLLKLSSDSSIEVSFTLYENARDACFKNIWAIKNIEKLAMSPMFIPNMTYPILSTKLI